MDIYKEMLEPDDHELLAVRGASYRLCQCFLAWIGIARKGGRAFGSGGRRRPRQSHLDQLML